MRPEDTGTPANNAPFAPPQPVPACPLVQRARVLQECAVRHPLDVPYARMCQHKHDPLLPLGALSCRCTTDGCTLCMSDSDMRALAVPNAEPFELSLVLNRGAWAPAWRHARQEMSVKAFEHMIQACHTIDSRSADGVDLDVNRAACRTFPSAWIFSSLLKSQRKCAN